MASAAFADTSRFAGQDPREDEAILDRLFAEAARSRYNEEGLRIAQWLGEALSEDVYQSGGGYRSEWRTSITGSDAARFIEAAGRCWRPQRRGDVLEPGIFGLPPRIKIKG